MFKTHEEERAWVVGVFFCVACCLKKARKLYVNAAFMRQKLGENGVLIFIKKTRQGIIFHFSCVQFPARKKN